MRQRAYDVKGLVLVDGLVEGVREPLLEVLLAAKDLRHQEMHERPELHDVVLERGASKEKAPLGVKPEERLPALTLEIFDVLSLI